jgi:hypothetical protein
MRGHLRSLAHMRLRPGTKLTLAALAFAAVWEVFTAQPAFRHLHYGEQQPCTVPLPFLCTAGLLSHSASAERIVLASHGLH